MWRAFSVCMLALALACHKTSDPGDADATDAGDETPATSTSAVQIIVEPSDNASALLASIQSATTSVHMTMYLLTSSSIINALIARHQAGLDVRVVLNQNFPDTTTSNTNVFNQLKNAGVGVVWAPSTFVYTHEKAVVVDGTSVWIMTMNVTYSSPTSNREYLALDTDPDDVAEADALFEADYANTAFTPVGKLLVAPINARDGMLAVIQNTQATLDVEGEELSDAAITSALIAAHDRGVAVRIVMSDDVPSPTQAGALQSIEQDGIVVHKLSTPYIHAKAFVADGALAYVGSENFTQNSLDSNRELGLIIDAASEIAKISTTIDADFNAGVPY